MSEKLRGVHPREGGPYSLYCYDCVTWVPNTANSEMIKEGCFSHSHWCKPKEEKRNLQAGLTEGTICQQINSGIFLACFNQDYHKVMLEALEKWQESLGTMKPDDPVYSFAYWLFRYSGLIKPVASPKSGRQEEIIRALEAEVLRLQRINMLALQEVGDLRVENKRLRGRLEKAEKVVEAVKQLQYEMGIVYTTKAAYELKDALAAYDGESGNHESD